jgi:hypothetical protein
MPTSNQAPCIFSPWYSWIIAHLALNNNHSWVPLAELDYLSIHCTCFFCGIRVAQSLVFCVVFCRLLFVLLSFFFWSLYCLSVTDIQLLITLLISSTFLMFHRLYYAIKTKTHSNVFKVFFSKLTNYIYCTNLNSE